jgi:uncharacterized phage protein gp47/JayE
MPQPFGLSELGFKKKTLEDIKAQIEEAIVDAFGAVNLESDGVFGQLVGVFSVPIANLWQELENTYFSQYTATAEGVSLDNAVQLVGISRLEATNTRVLAALTGDQGTLIPAGTQVEVDETGDLFESVQDGIITRTNALVVEITVTLVLLNTNYTVVVNGQPIIFNSGATPTADSIAFGLTGEINSTAQPVTATDLGGGVFEIRTDQNELPFSTVVSADLTVTSRTSPVLFEATVTGPIAVPAGTFTEIVTPVAGWASVTNFDPSIQGRETETDIELRLRALESIRVVGAGSAEAIRARLRQQVQDVVNALVFENREPFVDAFGRPPHSFEAVVVGGADTEIAEKIWEVKPAGIQTFGNVSVLITDSNDDQQEIRFSRPELVYIWANVELRILAGSFPADGVALVREAIAQFGNESFNVGQKVIYQQFFSAIYEVAGILEVELEFATSLVEAGPPGAFSIGNVAISQVQAATFDVARINVTIV